MDALRKAGAAIRGDKDGDLKNGGGESQLVGERGQDGLAEGQNNAVQPISGQSNHGQRNSEQPIPQDASRQPDEIVLDGSKAANGAVDAGNTAPRGENGGSAAPARNVEDGRSVCNSLSLSSGE